MNSILRDAQRNSGTRGCWGSSAPLPWVTLLRYQWVLALHPLLSRHRVEKTHTGPPGSHSGDGSISVWAQSSPSSALPPPWSAHPHPNRTQQGSVLRQHQEAHCVVLRISAGTPSSLGAVNVLFNTLMTPEQRYPRAPSRRALRIGLEKV